MRRNSAGEARADIASGTRPKRPRVLLGNGGPVRCFATFVPVIVVVVGGGGGGGVCVRARAFKKTI